MNKEEIIKIANGLINDFKCDSDTMVDFCSSIITLLEQKRSADCVDRQALDEALYERFHEEDSPNNITDVRLGTVRNFVKNFPSVTPARKKGKPICDMDSQEWSLDRPLKCPFCNKRLVFDIHYCPNCGAEMESDT